MPCIAPPVQLPDPVSCRSIGVGAGPELGGGWLSTWRIPAERVRLWMVEVAALLSMSRSPELVGDPEMTSPPVPSASNPPTRAGKPWADSAEIVTAPVTVAGMQTKSAPLGMVAPGQLAVSFQSPPDAGPAQVTEVNVGGAAAQAAATAGATVSTAKMVAPSTGRATAAATARRRLPMGCPDRRDQPGGASSQRANRWLTVGLLLIARSSAPV